MIKSNIKMLKINLSKLMSKCNSFLFQFCKSCGILYLSDSYLSEMLITISRDLHGTRGRYPCRESLME